MNMQSAFSLLIKFEAAPLSAKQIHLIMAFCHKLFLFLTTTIGLFYFTTLSQSQIAA
jgi:hypothetical protein